jgi:hypothetical protein
MLHEARQVIEEGHVIEGKSMLDSIISSIRASFDKYPQQAQDVAR